MTPPSKHCIVEVTLQANFHSDIDNNRAYSSKTAKANGFHSPVYASCSPCYPLLIPRVKVMRDQSIFHLFIPRILSLVRRAKEKTKCPTSLLNFLLLALCLWWLFVCFLLIPAGSRWPPPRSFSVQVRRTLATTARRVRNVARLSRQFGPPLVGHLSSWPPRPHFALLSAAGSGWIGEP